MDKNDQEQIYDFSYVYPYHDESIESYDAVSAIKDWFDTIKSSTQSMDIQKSSTFSMDIQKLGTTIIIYTWPKDDPIRAVYSYYLARDIYLMNKDNIDLIQINNLIYDCIGAEPDWNNFLEECNSLDPKISYRYILSNMQKTEFEFNPKILDEIVVINKKIDDWIVSLKLN